MDNEILYEVYLYNKKNFFVRSVKDLYCIDCYLCRNLTELRGAIGNVLTLKPKYYSFVNNLRYGSKEVFKKRTIRGKYKTVKLKGIK